eukprot:scaffold40430_cov65-Phaeocystis_antarctica.AAC.5
MRSTRSCIARAASKLSESTSATPRSLTTSRCAWRSSSSAALPTWSRMSSACVTPGRAATVHGGGGGEGEPLALRVAAIRGVCRGRGAEAHRCRGAEAHLSDRQDLLCCHTAADVDAVVVPGRTVEPRASLRAPPLATHGDRPLVRVRQPPKPLGASDGGEEGGPQRQGSSESEAPCRARPSSASSAQAHSSSSTGVASRGDEAPPPPAAPSAALAASPVASSASAAASAVTPSRCVAAMSSARCATRLTRAGCVWRARKTAGPLMGPLSRLETQRTPW